MRQEIEARKTVEYQMMLAIAENPYKQDPQELWKALTPQKTINKVVEPKFDAVGFELLKSRMQAPGGKMLVKS